MNLLKKVSILFISMTTLFACKKDNTETNWTEELKGSVWVGEFKYTNGHYTELQPFSVVINTDGTLTWYDQQNSRPGGKWKTEGDKITITLPNNTAVSAKLTRDAWMNFTSTADIGFEIANLSKSQRPAPSSLDNTIWTGTVTRAVSVTEKVKITLLPGNKSDISLPSIIYSQTYKIEGGGIRIDLGFANVYFVFLNNMSGMNGYHNAAALTDYVWDLKRN